ncbi:hypothetical protein [Dissulfurispira thermophila]|uniref:Uncharacterized protein n=1 Tax=hot springs metagenome TaxID=433727 RepID=A0A5J4L0T1_9ZZZZ|nr:hypothetical protein [Dissulfurispira thermophila]
MNEQIEKIKKLIKDCILLVDKNSEKRIIFEAKSLCKYHDYQYFLKRQMVQKDFKS